MKTAFAKPVPAPGYVLKGMPGFTGLTPDQDTRLLAIREAAETFLYALSRNCPMSRERAIAKDKIEEALYWANTSIYWREVPRYDDDITVSP